MWWRTNCSPMPHQRLSNHSVATNRANRKARNTDPQPPVSCALLAKLTTTSTVSSSR